MPPVKTVLEAIVFLVMTVSSVGALMWLIVRYHILRWADAIALVPSAAEQKRWTEAFERLPDKEWFQNVGTALQVLAGQAVMLTDHTGAIADLKHELQVVSNESRSDHDMLVALRTTHNILTGSDTRPCDPRAQRRRMGDRPEGA
jgi:hypothetical protein